MELVATGLAHEVRNPLNALQLNLRILTDELRNQPLDPSLALFAVLARISSGIGQIDRFVSDFLRYTRPIRLTREPVPVRAFVAELAEFLVNEAGRHGVRIDVVGQTTAVVEADRVQLRQALINVALDGIEASPRGSAVAIDLAQDGADVTICISDAGPLVSAGAGERAFEPFSMWRDGSTGLALPIARRIVEAHGGTLVFEGVSARRNCARMRLPALRRG